MDDDDEVIERDVDRYLYPVEGEDEPEDFPVSKEEREYGYTMDGLIDALAVFKKYRNSRFEIAAEHDVIYAGPDTAEMEEDDVRALLRLGWHHDEDAERMALFV